MLTEKKVCIGLLKNVYLEAHKWYLNTRFQPTGLQ